MEGEVEGRCRELRAALVEAQERAEEDRKAAAKAWKASVKSEVHVVTLTDTAERLKVEKVQLAAELLVLKQEESARLRRAAATARTIAAEQAYEQEVATAVHKAEISASATGSSPAWRRRRGRPLYLTL